MDDVLRAEGIHPRNLSAQLRYVGAGNPPVTHPDTAISNAFPGLEMDFRNVWRRIFVGIELHESSNVVLDVDEGSSPGLQALKRGYVLETVNDVPVEGPVLGPDANGDIGPLPEGARETRMSLEWSNSLAHVVWLAVQRASGEGDSPPVQVECVFRPLRPGDEPIRVRLTLRPFFASVQLGDGSTALHPIISPELAPPGYLSQSLCSPWQNDYRECACFYWAASRPDFVNVETRPDGTAAGHNWLHKDRTPDTPQVYVRDDFNTSELVSYEDLFRDWERALRFQIGGRDSE